MGDFNRHVGDFNRHVGKCSEGFEGVHAGNGIRKRNEKGGRFCDEKRQPHNFIRKTKRKSSVVPVDVKQILILCLLKKNTESI